MWVLIFASAKTKFRQNTPQACWNFEVCFEKAGLPYAVARPFSRLADRFTIFEIVLCFNTVLEYLQYAQCLT